MPNCSIRNINIFPYYAHLNIYFESLLFNIQITTMHRTNTFKFLSKRNKKLKTQDFHWAGFLNAAAAKANPNGLWHFAALIPTTSINYVPKTQQTTSQQTTPSKHTRAHTQATPLVGWLRQELPDAHRCGLVLVRNCLLLAKRSTHTLSYTRSHGQSFPISC